MEQVRAKVQSASCLLFLLASETDFGGMADAFREILLLNFGKEDPFRVFNSLVNRLIIPDHLSVFLVDKLGSEMGYYSTCYLRDLLLGSILYWLIGGLWHFAIYNVGGNVLFRAKKRPLPTWATILDQMILAQSSLLLYAMLPILSEFLIESRYTRCYFYLDEVGGFLPYLVYLILYITIVEIGIYWIHRTLHTNKFLYKHIHALHHKYNRAQTLTPWASIAFHPLDGILQVSTK